MTLVIVPDQMRLGTDLFHDGTGLVVPVSHMSELDSNEILCVWHHTTVYVYVTELFSNIHMYMYTVNYI